MGVVRRLADGLADWAAEALTIRPDQLHFVRADVARLTIVLLIGFSIAALLIRTFKRQSSSRIGLPSLLEWGGSARLTLLRHGALLLALAGLACFALALADPKSALTRQETSHPGRRISLMIDASSSMLSSLPSRLARGAPNDAAFFTTVGAARYFVELRMKGKYRDLIALVEFGDQAYVITPFTNDYENVLLSMALIGDWNEFMRFPDQGTVIANAIDQSVGLFRTFDVLDAAGNAMVIFTDGMDAEVTEDGRSAFDVLGEADRANIPIYFVRTAAPTRSKPAVSDEAWAAAVARTGGRFYNVTDESTLVRAVQDIDRSAPGRIEMRRYTTDQPQFAVFAIAAVLFWSTALLLRLTVPWFQTFP